MPLTDEIREILEEYPDGQIFKVCKEKPLRNDHSVSGIWNLICLICVRLNIFTMWSS